MGVPLQVKQRCVDCKKVFTLDTRQRHSRARAHCPHCGSLYFERVTNQSPRTDLAGITKSGKMKHVARNEAPNSEKARRKHASVAAALSAPTNYRLVTLMDRHKRVKAEKAKAARLARENELRPIEYLKDA